MVIYEYCCGQEFKGKAGLHIHQAKHNHDHSLDLIKLGVVKRKLTRGEASKVTKEVMELGLKSPDARFNMAIIKAIDITS